MNNEAFRSLVNSNRKSTKEIARQAVENEFRKRKRHKDDQGYGSDSDSDDAEAKPRRGGEAADNEAEPVKLRKREKKPEYRDRARERREGKAVDYALLDVGSQVQAQEGPLTAEDRKRQTELSKYLGGDEEHTHLVKGLDRVLAQKVRREEMGQKEDDFDEMMEEAFEKRNASVAGEGGLHSIKPKTELGKSMLNYLLQKQERESIESTGVKVNPALQKSLQRSFLTFSLNSDPRRRKHAWDAPQMSIQAFTNDNVRIQKATPLDKQMIATITTKLKGHLLRMKHGNITDSRGMVKNAHEASKHDDAANQNDAKIDDSNRKATKKSLDSDSDDDIFANVGDYVPPSAEGAKVNGDATNSAPDSKDANAAGDTTKKKQSIFDNLITKSAAPAQTRKVQLQLPQQKTKNVINRDVIGASSSEQPTTKRRGPHTAAMEGYSMSHYDGGYGEDIDVDFGNFDEDDRRKKKDEDKDDGAGKEEEEENDF